ncbi:MAG: glycosyltransferase family 1 protein [Pseudomonadota bacterium]
MARRLIINGRFLTGAPTAVNAVARSLTQALANHEGAQGWQVTVAVPPAAKAEATRDNLPHEVVGTRNGIGWEQIDLPAMRRQGVVAGFFNTVPLIGQGYVTMLHDAQVFTAPQSYGRPTRAWRQLLSRRAGARGNRLLTVSDFSKDELVRLRIAPPERIGVVHNGLGAVVRETPDRSIIARLGLAERGYGLALSSLLPHKNIGILFKAFADPRLSACPLVLFGAPGRADFEAAGFAVPQNVVFAGRVSDSELAALYAAALAVLTPSTTEGFGLPPLEGMAHGTPAVVAPCGALPEVVGDAARQAAPDDPVAWADAVAALRDDSDLWDDLARRGRERASGFTWQRAAEVTLAHLSRWFADR